MSKYLITVSWPKGAKGDDCCQSTVEMDARERAEAWSKSEARWPEHDVLAITEAELQHDGRWTFPREDRGDHYFVLAGRWARTLGPTDPRRFSTVVTRPNSPESRAFLDRFNQETEQ